MLPPIFERASVSIKKQQIKGYARTAAMSANKNYALAGLWLEILAYAVHSAAS
jgi:hypothetical protein